MKLKLKQPLKSFSLTQRFGENKNGYYAKAGMPGHSGIDLRAPHGEPVYAAHDGIAYYEIDEHQGHGVTILSDVAYELLDGKESFIKTIYWHLVDSLVEPSLKSPVENKPLGLVVKTGDIIGYADNTGQSTGNHLHFGLKPVARNSNGQWYNIYQSNGYYGAVDPLPYVDIKQLPTTFLKKGMKGEEVTKLQKFLNEFGNNLVEDGNFGKNTEAAVKVFQKIKQLSPDGIVGSKTLEAIKNTI